MRGRKNYSSFLIAVIIILLFVCSTEQKKELAEKHYQTGLSYQKSNQIDSALIEFQHAIKLNPKHTKAHVTYTNIMRWDKNKYEEVLTEYQEKIVQHPENEVYHYILGLLSDSPDEMKKEALKAIEINPKYSRGYTLLASAFQGEEDFSSAINEYQKAIALDSTDSHAYYGLAYSYSRLDSFDRSNTIYRKILKLDSTSYSVYNSIWSNIIQKEGNTPEVKKQIISEIEALLTKTGYRVPVLYNTLWTLKALGEQEKIRELEEKIIQQDTTGKYAPSVVLNRLYEFRSPEERLKYCEKFLVDYPNSDLKSFMFANISRIVREELKSGEEKAIEWGERWIRECPDDANAYNDIVWNIYQHREDKLNLAFDYIKKAVALAKPYQKSYITDTMGWIYFKKGMYVQAESTLIEANRLYDEPDPEVTFHLGVAYGKNGRLEEALKTLALSLALKDDDQAKDYFRLFYREKFGTEEGVGEYLTRTILGEASVPEPYPAPDFTLMSIRGDTIRLSDYKDKVILVAFWKPT